MPGDATDSFSEILHSVWNVGDGTKYRDPIILN
jgi:hypothetical protein